MLKQMIRVSFSKLGTHLFPGAAANPELANVAFLANQHPHTFRITLLIEVRDEEREIEFYQLRLWLGEVLGPEIVHFGPKSCETIARELHDTVGGRYPDRAITVRVDEDADHGAEVSS